ncbi:MAG: hypothetical protein IK013_07580 [Bacteroidales bacterium]|nr:hypothetical protein [Bacteroidales bacterium]
MMFVLLTVAFCLAGMAQPTEKQKMTREQLAEKQAYHIALDLSNAFKDEISGRFVKTYVAYQKEIWALGPRIPEITDDMTEEQVDKILKQRFERSQKILAIREKYYKIYSEFLTPKQIEMVYRTDREMMRRMSQAKKGGTR